MFLWAHLILFFMNHVLIRNNVDNFFLCDIIKKGFFCIIIVYVDEKEYERTNF